MASGLDLDKLRYHLGSVRRELKAHYDGSTQASSYIETILRHVKAIIETPEESRLHNKAVPYPDEALVFLHACHPLLLDVRRMATEIGEMLYSLSVNYARSPGISAAGIVYAAMEGVVGKYLSTNGAILDELAACLPKASKFTIRERYLEVCSVVFDLGQYLTDIGHPVEHIPAWRQMSSRPPPKRHLFVAILPMVLRHWKQLLAAQKIRGAPALRYSDRDVKGERLLWTALFPHKAYPGGPDKKQAEVTGDQVPIDLEVASGENQSVELEGEPGGDCANQNLPIEITEKLIEDAIEEQLACAEAHTRKRKRAETETIADAAGSDIGKGCKRKTLAPEEDARRREQRKIRDRAWRARRRMHKYRTPGMLELTPITPNESRSSTPTTFPQVPVVDVVCDEPSQGQRDVLLANRSVYMRVRKCKRNKWERPRNRSVLAFLTRWQKAHMGDREPQDVTEGTSRGARLKSLLYSGIRSKAVPIDVFPTSLVMARMLLSETQGADEANVDDDILFDAEELDGYICNPGETAAKHRQWQEDGLDTVLAAISARRQKKPIASESAEDAGRRDADNQDEDGDLAYEQAATDVLNHATDGMNLEDGSEGEEEEEDTDLYDEYERDSQRVGLYEDRYAEL
jgi:hypothetical protein